MNYICKCNRTNFSNKNYTYWEDRRTTTDELEIIEYLKKFCNMKHKNILHIGIGNSFLANNFVNDCQITGITISNKEILKAKSLNLDNYNYFLCDKYSNNFKDLIKDKKFDFIVDTNLKSYSCCQKTFEFMMANMFASIKKSGELITSRNGMDWVKELKPKLSFSMNKLFYFKLKEVEGKISNKLSLEEIKTLSNRHNIKMSFDKKLCYLKK